jgi:uroporphyrinogen III methyltransferase/synthase
VTKVYLIGAGPGHPDLISVRGRRCLSQADVVVFDHRTGGRLLRHARRDAERIDVGHAAPQPLEQEAICYLLAEKAREGKVVARVKWGDPFLFDRGGPEALFLHEQGIPFEVVPGVPVGLGAASYAGVPLTYPGGGDTVTFLRGHEDETDTLAHVDWRSLAKLEGTIVCFAGPGHATRIAQSLLEHGRSPDDSAALIYDGTLPTQSTSILSVAELAAAGEPLPDRRGAILIVGRVAAFREHLRWADRQPLFGTRVLVTRAREQAAELVEPLEALGAVTIEAPMIRIAPPEDLTALDAACAAAGTFDWIVFTSTNAVAAFMDRLLASKADVRALHNARLGAVGPATAATLARYSLKVDAQPSEYRAEAVASELACHGTLEGARILLPRADIGRDVITSELTRRGAQVTKVVAYRNLATDPEQDGGPDVYKLLLERQLDVVTFTSASAVQNMVRVLGEEPAIDLLNATAVAVIGPVTAEAAAAHHIRTAIVPTEYTVPALVRAIAEYVDRQA